MAVAKKKKTSARPAKKTSNKPGARPAPKTGEIFVLYCDGACRGNPGPSSVGAVLYRGEEKAGEISENIGHATNNVAEYTALIRGLEMTRSLNDGSHPLEIRMDSELAVRQVLGEYKVKNPALQNLHSTVRQTLSHFRKWTIKHVPREQNREADALANRALDNK